MDATIWTPMMANVSKLESCWLGGCKKTPLALKRDSNEPRYLVSRAWLKYVHRVSSASVWRDLKTSLCDIEWADIVGWNYRQLNQDHSCRAAENHDGFTKECDVWIVAMEGTLRIDSVSKCTAGVEMYEIRTRNWVRVVQVDVTREYVFVTMKQLEMFCTAIWKARHRVWEMIIPFSHSQFWGNNWTCSDEMNIIVGWVRCNETLSRMESMF